MLSNIISQIIQTEFENCGAKWRDGPPNNKAMVLHFRLTNSAASLILYGDARYIGVYVYHDVDGLSCIGYHDSGWKNSLDKWLFDNRLDIRGINWIKYPKKHNQWYEIIGFDQTWQSLLRIARNALLNPGEK
jgi:hypothetical protein